jgi:hypothetical protein
MSPRPHCLSQLSEIIGAEAAQVLSRQLGGTEWYIGTDIPEDHPITQSIGRALAHHLSLYMAGIQLEVPQNMKTRRKQRNAEIRCRVDEGESTRAIALEVGLSQRMIRYILSH